MDVARPGASTAELARAAVNPLNKSGFAGTIKYGLGHGVGLDLPEPYDVDLGCQDSVTDNMVLLYKSGLGLPTGRLPLLWVDRSSFSHGACLISISRNWKSMDNQCQL